MSLAELVSVIVPVYNVAEYLARCVNSIRAQTYQNLEIILIDDGSADASGAMCDEFAEGDTRIIALHQGNAGQSAARNKGLNKAKGRYVAFIDSDDFWDLDMVEYMVQLLESRKSQIAVCAVRHVGFPRIKEPEVTDAELADYTGVEAAKLTLLGLRGFSGSACHALFERETVLKDQFFLEGHIYEDLEYMVRVMLDAKKVTVSHLQKYNYCYRTNNSSSTSTRKRKNDLDAVTAQTLKLLMEKSPELVPCLEQRYISNGNYLLRSLHPGEQDMFKELREAILQYNPDKQALSKSDWVLVNALKYGKCGFKATDYLYRKYKAMKGIAFARKR